MITLLSGGGAPLGLAMAPSSGTARKQALRLLLSNPRGEWACMEPARSLLGYDPRSISGEDSELSIALFSFGVAVRAVLSRRVRRRAELSRQTGAGNRAVRARRGDRRGVSPARSEIVREPGPASARRQPARRRLDHRHGHRRQVHAGWLYARCRQSLLRRESQPAG